METPEIFHNLHPYYSQLKKWRSTRKLLYSSFYKSLEPSVKNVLENYEIGHYAIPQDSTKANYRAVSWNIERGICFEGILKTLGEHPVLSQADIYFCPEADLGMARSQNRNVSRALAKTLGLNYVFFPAYLNLEKGNGVEMDIEGENALGLHGNTIFSRWPIQNPRKVRLKNCKDKMRGKEKRIGSQSAVVADIALPSGSLRTVCLHLDAHSSQRQRYFQTKTVLDFLRQENWQGPTLLGGDWNTSTYHASHAFFAWWSFWRKILMGPKYVRENHYPYPERYFERRLFKFLEERGFDYKKFNELGVPTIHYHLGDERKNKNMQDWTPKFFQIFVDWAVKKAEGIASFKLDWFAAQGLKPIAGSQRVIGNLIHNSQPISDHDAIVVDFLFDS